MNNAIRDYLYLDIDRVRSIYAQASGGLTESIRELQQEIDSRGEEQHDKNETLSKNAMLGSGRIATRVLHDYLFTSVESKLSEKIVDVCEDTISQLSTGALFRVSGRAEIDDIARMLKIMENYNDMYKYLLTIGHSSEIQDKLWELEEELESIEDTQASSKTRNAKNKKKDIENQIQELEPENIATRILRDQRAGISPIIAETFKRVYSLLYNNIFEVKIVSEFDETKVFRGILNKEFLKEDPTIIYAKYGSRPSVSWTMVGQVTTIKLPKKLKVEVETETLPRQDGSMNESEEEQESDLRDAFENLYRLIAEVEEILIGPGNRTTWIATPLAIYHEVN